jgi:NADH-quinone oxidoreductase subunit J
MEDLLHLILLGTIILMAFIVAEAEDMLYAVLGLLGMCVSIGLLYWVLSAPYVAVFQLAIYGGAVIVLLISVVMLTRGEEGE